MSKLISKDDFIKLFDNYDITISDSDYSRFEAYADLLCEWNEKINLTAITDPEGISIKQRPLYFPNKCIHCNTCVHTAKNGGVYEHDGNIKLDISKDENWEEIIDACPAVALTMDSREMTVEEAIEEASKDEPFFKYGGGVTLSGGEPLFQHEFAIGILKGLKEKKIATSIETALNVKSEVVREAIKYLDHVFADCKIIDEEQHKNIQE